jgi:hypothetical protein
MRPPENRWTLHDEATLFASHQQGLTPDEIAGLINKTPGSVRAKLTELGIASLPTCPPGMRKNQVSDREAARRSDLAFQRAMLTAIDSGAERAPVADTVRSEVLADA